MAAPSFKLLPDQWDMDSVVEHIIVHYRFIFVMFLLPVSFIYDIWFWARNKMVFAMSSAPTKHKEKVADIQRQVREYHARGEGKGMCTARPGWQTISPQNMEYKAKMYPISINLVDILKIDPERRTVRCEPLVTMGQLTEALDRLGWTIPIVPELDDLLWEVSSWALGLRQAVTNMDSSSISARPTSWCWPTVRWWSARPARTQTSTTPCRGAMAP